MMKDEAYAASKLSAPISPLDGVYNSSGIPTMVPPPTHVANMHEGT